jgi:hypothetical protein
LSKRCQGEFELAVQPRRKRAERTGSLKQTGDERMIDVRRPLVDLAGLDLCSRCQAIGVQPVHPSVGEHVSSCT